MRVHPFELELVKKGHVIQAVRAMSARTGLSLAQCYREIRSHPLFNLRNRRGQNDAGMRLAEFLFQECEVSRGPLLDGNRPPLPEP